MQSFKRREFLRHAGAALLPTAVPTVVSAMSRVRPAAAYHHHHRPTILEQWYDLERNPFETRDHAADPSCARALAHHRALLAAWVHHTNDTMARGYLIYA